MKTPAGSLVCPELAAPCFTGGFALLPPAGAADPPPQVRDGKVSLPPKAGAGDLVLPLLPGAGDPLLPAPPGAG